MNSSYIKTILEFVSNLIYGLVTSNFLEFSEIVDKELSWNGLAYEKKPPGQPSLSGQ